MNDARNVRGAHGPTLRQSRIPLVYTITLIVKGRCRGDFDRHRSGRRIRANLSPATLSFSAVGRSRQGYLLRVRAGRPAEAHILGPESSTLSARTTFVIQLAACSGGHPETTGKGAGHGGEETSTFLHPRGPL